MKSKKGILWVITGMLFGFIAGIAIVIHTAEIHVVEDSTVEIVVFDHVFVYN